MTDNNNTGRQLTKVESLKKMLDAPSVQEQFQNALAENSGPFVASIIELFSGDNYLQDCDPKQVVMEALKAAILKLPINKNLGFAYIVAYNKRPQFQIGYKGLIQLALRTSFYRNINADVVYEGELKYKDKLTGVFDLTGTAKSDTVIGYFAYFELQNGFSKTLYMSKERVLAHAEKYSKSFNEPKGPWKKEFDAMAIKTVLRNLLTHWGMLSVEMISAIDSDSDPDQDTADKVRKEVDNEGNATVIDFEDVPDGFRNPNSAKAPF